MTTFGERFRARLRGGSSRTSARADLTVEDRLSGLPAPTYFRALVGILVLAYSIVEDRATSEQDNLIAALLDTVATAAADPTTLDLSRVRSLQKSMQHHPAWICDEYVLDACWPQVATLVLGDVISGRDFRSAENLLDLVLEPLMPAEGAAVSLGGAWMYSMEHRGQLTVEQQKACERALQACDLAESERSLDELQFEMSVGSEEFRLVLFARPEAWYLRGASQDTTGVWWQNDALEVVPSPVAVGNLSRALTAACDATRRDLPPVTSWADSPEDPCKGQLERLAGVRSVKAFLMDSVAVDITCRQRHASLLLMTGNSGGLVGKVGDELIVQAPNHHALAEAVLAYVRERATATCWRP